MVKIGSERHGVGYGESVGRVGVGAVPAGPEHSAADFLTS